MTKKKVMNSSKQDKSNMLSQINTVDKNITNSQPVQTEERTCPYT
jgi:hypothetical protein